jgi:serine phosphatase RsbU (regulator of sigma subunit)
MSKSLYNRLFVLLYFPVCVSAILNAQTVDTIYISADSIEDNAITLNDVWRYHSGNDSSWASPTFDDSDWDTLRSRMVIEEVPEGMWKGIGWFRTVIKIDSSLRFKQVAFEVVQYGASEFYLNGRLIKKLGKIGKDVSTETPFQRLNIPFAVVLDSSITYLLAVRYSNKAAADDETWYRAWFGYIGFELQIREIDESILNKVNYERTTLAVNIGIAGLFLALFLLYLALFIFYADRKENLYFALFNFSISVIFFASMILRYIQSNLELMSVINGITSSGLVLVFPFYLGFLYSIFYRKVPKYFYGIWIITISLVVVIILSLGEETISDYLLLGFIFLLTIEGLRVIIVAIKNNKPNSNIIGAGVILFVLFVIMLFIAGIFGININSYVGLIIFFMGLLSLPISMSVYLARDIALTNKDLAQQLQNVKELSEKELEQKLRAQRAEAENERKTKELEEARQLQLSMLPKELPQLTHIEIAVYMQTATEVGGDYYDFHIGIDGTLTAVIGDATGHGMKAGTMVTAAKSIFNSYVNNPDIIFTFQEFNRVIKGMQLPSMSMCLSLLKIKGNQLTMSAAGMPHALLYRNEIKKVEEIILKGMPLGAVYDFPYQTKTAELKSGDTLLLLSDGLPELFNDNKEMFGYDRVTKEYEKVASNKANEIIEHLKNIGADWVNGNDPEDDVTFVVLKMK